VFTFDRKTDLKEKGMADRRENKKKALSGNIDITDEDVYEAMKEIPGYVDITTGDFKEIYRHAYTRAIERILRAVKAKDIMTKKVVAVDSSTPLTEVARLLGVHGISGLPVVGEGGELVGVISEKDFIRHMGVQDKTTFMMVLAECLEGKACSIQPVRGQSAGDIMNSPAITVEEDRSIAEIAAVFKEKNINRVPVLNQKGDLVGIVSRADILQSGFFEND
jgi:CBS domain-containing membrane protein